MWKKILIGLFGIMLFGTIFAACRVVDADTLPKNPKAQMGTSVFVQDSITIAKGDKLDLVNTATDAHVILNGTWAGTTAKPAVESGAPTINTSVAGSATVTVGPFNTAGTYHIYCSVHQGMQMTVIVQ